MIFSFSSSKNLKAPNIEAKRGSGMDYYYSSQETDGIYCILTDKLHYRQQKC